MVTVLIPMESLTAHPWISGFGQTLQPSIHTGLWFGVITALNVKLIRNINGNSD
jgi:hypothetical protein